MLHDGEGNGSDNRGSRRRTVKGIYRHDLDELLSVFPAGVFSSIDPCLQNAKAEFTFAFDSINKDVICCHSVGRFTQTDFLACVYRCKQVSQSVFDYYREVTKNCANIM